MSIFTIMKQPVSHFSHSLFLTDKSKYLPPNPRFEIVISLADLIAYLAWLCVRQIILGRCYGFPYEIYNNFKLLETVWFHCTNQKISFQGFHDVAITFLLVVGEQVRFFSFSLHKKIIQWGLEYRTCSVFRWSMAFGLCS